MHRIFEVWHGRQERRDIVEELKKNLDNTQTFSLGPLKKMCGDYSQSWVQQLVADDPRCLWVVRWWYCNAEN